MLKELTVTALLMGSLVVPSASSGCSPFSDWGDDACSANPDGDGVDVGGDITVPGTGPEQGTGGETGGSGSSAPDDAAPKPEPILPAPGECNTRFCAGPKPGTPAIPDVTLSDIASFRPAPPSLGAEPAGLGIAGLPTNLVATSGTQTIPGMLFSLPVSVTFTPQRHIFDNGDGTRTTATTPGASWASLGQAQFTPTPTSHTYAASGTYAVSVTTVYGATVNFGTTTRTVIGEVTAASAGQNLRILEARTGLVDRTCTENPRGPGC